MLTIQNYKKVESLEEAYELNQKKANRIVNLIKFIRYYLCKLICWIIVRKSATKNC